METLWFLRFNSRIDVGTTMRQAADTATIAVSTDDHQSDGAGVELGVTDAVGVEESAGVELVDGLGLVPVVAEGLGEV